MFCGGGILELLKKRAHANHSVFGSRIVRELWLFVIFIEWVSSTFSTSLRKVEKGGRKKALSLSIFNY